MIYLSFLFSLYDHYIYILSHIVTIFTNHIFTNHILITIIYINYLYYYYVNYVYHNSITYYILTKIINYVINYYSFK